MRPTPTLLGSSLALALATPPLALAQAGAQSSSAGNTQQPALLSPVTVTGENDSPYLAPEASQSKFTAPLVDTPKSVQVIPQAVIQDSAATSLEEVLRNSPGITFGAGEGGQPLADRPFIRGNSSGGNIYVDGIRDPGGQSRETFNLESVEVVRGADSAFGGRGSGGGSINLVSKRARLGSFAAGSLGYGTDGYLRATADGNWQFNDNSAFRLNVLGAKGNTPGRNMVDYKKFGIAPSFSLGLGTPTRVNFSFYHLNTDDTPDYGVPIAGRKGIPMELSNGDTGIVDVDRDAFYGLRDRDFRKTRSDIGTIEIEHDLSETLTVRNATRYGENINDYVVTNPGDSDAVFNPVDGQYWIQRATKSRWQKNTLLSNVTELSGEAQTGSLKHRFNVGMEFARETVRRYGYDINTTSGSPCPAGVFDPGAMDCTPLLAPNPGDSWSGSVERGDLAQDTRSSTQSVYLFDTIDITDAFQVNAGLRYDRYRISGFQSGRGGVTTEGSSRWNTFNYQLGLVYKPAPNGSVYLSYATASTPPTVSGGDEEGISQDMGDLKPEKSATIELGTKWNVLDERLGLTAALFQTERKNANIEVEPGITEQAGKTRVRGLELGIAGQITPKWEVFGGYAFMDSELLKGAYTGVNEGDPLANTPKHSFSLWTTYKVMPELTVGAGAYYVGKRFGGNQGQAGGGNNAIYMPSYWRFDAMAAYQVNKNLALQLNAMNIGNKSYYVRTNGTHHADFGPGRQVILSANLRY